MEKVKLHRCSYTFLHVDMDACWKVQRHLDEAGIPYEVVKAGFKKGKRPKLEAISGQSLLPVIEFADGKTYREDSAQMAETIKAGKLAEKDV